MALIVWPFALFGLSLYLILRIGALLGGDEPMFRASGHRRAALYFIGIFAPGAIDHHNVQLVLSLAMLLFLLRVRD